MIAIFDVLTRISLAKHWRKSKLEPTAWFAQNATRLKDHSGKNALSSALSNKTTFWFVGIALLLRHESKTAERRKIDDPFDRNRCNPGNRMRNDDAGQEEKLQL